MWKDPIVLEVRRAGEVLAEQSDYDIEVFFQNLRKKEKKRNTKVVSRAVLNQGLSKEDELIKT